jgi:hypothetical protein
MGGDDPTRNTQVHFPSDLQLKAISLRSCLDDPERVVLAAWGVDMKGLGSPKLKT